MPSREGIEAMTSTETIFKTDRLDAAIYLMATNRLKMIGIETVTNSKLAFCFEDDGHAEEYVYQFETGGLCSAKSLFATQKFLRSQMDKHINRRTPGVSHVTSNSAVSAR